MSTLHLNVETRETTGKEAAKVMRRQGQLPAVIYGHKETPRNLSVNAREFGELLAHHGTSNLVVLGGTGGGETVFIKSVQRHHVKNTPTAIEFLRVARDETIHVKVPVVLTGSTNDIKSGDGLLIHGLQEVELIGRADELPESVEVDISGLELDGAALHVSDITLPAGITIADDQDASIAAVNHPTADDVEVEVVAEGTGEATAASEASAVPTE